MSGRTERIWVPLLELNGIKSFYLNSFPPANEAVIKNNFIFLHVPSEEEPPPSVDDRLAESTTPLLFGGEVLTEGGSTDVDVPGA